MEKYELVPEQLLYEGTVTEENFFHPQQISARDLATTHLPEYIDRVMNLALSKKEIREMGYPLSRELVDRELYITMGTYECIPYAREYGIAINVAGGTHHAFADKGQGFCVFNDMAVAANLLLREHPEQRILILDLDVHQGNGTARLMEKENRVYTISVHGAHNFPMHKEKSDWDLPLEDHTGDRQYLKVLERVLQELPERFSPDFVFYISGADILESDKLGRLAMTVDGARKRDEMVLNYFRNKGIPLVASTGGGYSRQLAHIVETHANTFRIAAGLVE